ncbi:MAG: glycosyltransferase family 2 protein [Bacteroidota bacterium]
MNIVIPMAGEGSRFVKAGYNKPKPFIDVKGKPMIVRVIENLQLPEARFILIGRKSHFEAEKEIVLQIENEYNAIFVGIDKLTEGTACTVLFARSFIDTETPLLIANSDQIVDISMFDFVNDCLKRGLDGSILTFKDPQRNDKWSFAKTDENGLVLEVKEKMPISDIATVGIYFFQEGKYFVGSAIDMIIKNDRVNNEFYTCPVYNYLIAETKKIGVFNILQSQMHGLGTPEDLNQYVSTIV